MNAFSFQKGQQGEIRQKPSNNQGIVNSLKMRWISYLLSHGVGQEQMSENYK